MSKVNKMAHQANSESTKKWRAHQKCEIYNVNQKRWITGEVIDVFTDDEGQWVKVKYGRRTIEMSPNDEHLQAVSSDENILKWDNVVEAVKKELYPMISTAMGQSVKELIDSNTLKPNNFSDNAIEKVIGKMKDKKVLYNKEIEYIRDLVKRAKAFRWEESESMFLCHSLYLIELNHSGDTADLH